MRARASAAAAISPEAEKERLVAAIRMLERAEIIDFNGHCSIRRPGDRVLINSGRSVRSTLTADDIVTIGLDGALIDGSDPPPMEFHIHTEIYRRRPDVQAIVHAHPKWSTFFTMTGTPIEPVFAQGTLIGEMPLFDNPLSINSRELGEALAGTLGQARAALLKSHGAVVVGADIVEAFVLCVYLEENAYRQYMAMRLGEPYRFSDAEIEACRRNLWKPNLFAKAWEYYLSKLDR
jgi:ribulose-5-phosphate 4-epimerase/fuculose-1-phosphate aldolase